MRPTAFERTRSVRVPISTTCTYLCALAVIAVIAVTTHVLTERIVLRQARTAATVNLAGRQRMLSQRVTRWLEEIAFNPAQGSKRRAGIASALDRMEEVEGCLLHGNPAEHIPAPATKELTAIYLGEPYHLDREIREFVAHGRRALANPHPQPNDPDLRAMIAAANGPLLDSLDAAVHEYQAESEYDIHHLKLLMRALTTVLLIVLALEAVLIYRPLFNRLTRMIAQLTHASTTDFLTGVFNRRHFLYQAAADLARCRGREQAFSLIMVDLDHFKKVNDRCGHAVGDEVLCRFTSVAQLCLRNSDLLARLGGEEFAIALNGASLQHAAKVADKIRHRLASSPSAHCSGETIYVTASFGVVECGPSEEIGAALSRADRLLYAAKRLGRNCVLTAAPEGLLEHGKELPTGEMLAV